MSETKVFKFVKKPKSMEDGLNNLIYQLDILIRMQGLHSAIATLPSNAVETKVFMTRIIDAVVDQYNKDVGVDPEHTNVVIEKLKEMKVTS